jgi:VanZ family protein
VIAAGGMAARARSWAAPVLWAATLLYLGLIFYLSSQPDPLPELTQRIWDKALHLVEYGALGTLLAAALVASEASPGRAALIAATAASLYGATDELHQAFVPNRSCDVRDWAADTLGATLGAVAVALALKWIGARASIRPSTTRAP